MTVHNRRPITPLGRGIIIDLAVAAELGAIRCSCGHPSAAIKALVARGLVERHGSLIRLTEAGKQVAAELRRKAQHALP